MMGWPIFKSMSPIGLDLGTQSMKAAQLVRASGKWRIAAAVSIPRKSKGGTIGPVDLSRLREVLQRRGFTGDDVNIAVPAAGLLSDILELPARAPGVPIDQLARTEFARLHKVDPSTVTLSTWDLPAPARSAKTTHLMAVGAVSAAVQTQIDLVEGAGFRVTAVDDPSSAAARGSAAAVDPNATTFLIDWGWSAVNLVVVKRGSILYVRRLGELGLNTLHAEGIAALEGNAELFEFAINHPKLGTDNSDDGLAEVDAVLSTHLVELCREVTRATGYVSRRYADTSATFVHIIGGGSLIPGIAERAAVLAGADATVGTPAFGSAAGSPLDTGVSVLIPSAVGLAAFEGGD